MTWYVRIFDTDTKEIRYESLGTTKKTEATDLMLAKQAEGDFNRKASKMTLGEAFSRYLKNLEDKGSSAKTIYYVNDSLLSLQEFYNRPVDSITKVEVLEAFNRRNDKVKNSTYNARKTYVKCAFRFVMNVLEAIQYNPAESLKSRKALKQEREFWTLEQIDRILACAPSPEYRLMWSFMAFAGLRIHEVLKLLPTDIREGNIYLIGKGSKPAKVPVSSRLQQEMERVGNVWDFKDMSNNVRAIEKAAKVAIPEGFNGKANNHRLRHSFASNLIRAGANVKAVQKLMRHSNIQTTLNIYSHLIDNDLSNEVERMFTNKEAR